MNFDSDSLRNWVPERIISAEYVDPGRVRALVALLDSGTPVPGHGDELPPLWHWAALPEWPVSSELAPDGHPRRGRLLPPLPQPRRMFAGGTVTTAQPLRVGERIQRDAVVTSVDEKRGRSGAFVVVRVHHELRGPDNDLRIEERQDLVFRSSPPVEDRPADPAPAAELSPAGPPLRPHEHGWEVVTDPTLLMRFSAATANPHRIHYDWPHAVHVEGYPGLVVQGPLSTLLLAETLRLAEPDSTPRQLTHRNLAPLFCAQRAHISHATTLEGRSATMRRDETELVALSAEYASA